MPNVYAAKVNRTVNYRKTDGTWRAGVVTTIASDLNVTASSRTTGVTTLTVNNSLTTPRMVYVSLSDSTYNGVFQVATANATTVTYNQPGVTDDVSGGTGTIRDIDVCTLRVGHHGETYTTKLRRYDAVAASVDVWRPG